MSVVIIGGNECMTRQYKNLCSEYQCKAKIFTKRSGALKTTGSPDLLILFTSTVSHTMVKCALSEIKGENTQVARSHTSSMAALRNILEEYAG